MVYMVTYDLGEPSELHDGLSQALKKASDGEWACFWESACLIRSPLPRAADVFALLAPHLTSADHCLVIEVKGNFDGLLEEENWLYLRQRLGL